MVELVVGVSAVDCSDVTVVVSRGERRSVGLGVEVIQSADVIAKGALLVLDVLGLKRLLVELTASVVLDVILAAVDAEASVTLSVDSATSGLSAVGGDRGPAVLGSSGAAGGEMVAGCGGSSGAGDDVEDVVCGLTVRVVVGILVVCSVSRGFEDTSVAVVVLRVVVEGVVPLVVDEETAVEVG